MYILQLTIIYFIKWNNILLEVPKSALDIKMYC